MKQLAIFAILTALWGCRAAQQEAGIPITFAPTEQTPSKSNALTAGEIAGIFATTDGTDRYLMENTPFVVGADGRSLSTAPAVYYPEAKQAVVFTAYLPFGGTWSGGVGTFSVPNDQTSATALKQADLCWAKASSTPVATPVALEFQHKMARLLITTNTPTEKIAIPNAFSGGILDIKTGTFTNTLRSEVFTTGHELILPAQTVTRLVLTVSGVEYTFEGAILLESGKTTSISLTLSPMQKTATLSGSSTTNWTTATEKGNSSKSVSNALSFYWVPTHWRAAEVDKVVLTIKQGTSSADYTIVSGVTHNNSTFQFLFSANGIGYPYTIEKVALYKATELVQTTERHLGGTVYKAGAHTFGINAQPINPPAPSDYVKIGSLYWAKGNLVAVSKDNNRECKVGAPADHGLYFQSGSLIGYKGGALANGGTGIGATPYTGERTQYWGGATSYSWVNDAMVWPEEMVGTKTTWKDMSGANIATLNDYAFNYSVAPWNTSGQNIRNFSVPIAGDRGSGTLATGRYVPKGVGDPCSYYLGSTWRLPTRAEFIILCNNKGNVNVNYPPAECGVSWTTSPTLGGNFSGAKLFIPVAGRRYPKNGAFEAVRVTGYIWGSTVFSASSLSPLGFAKEWVYPLHQTLYSYAYPIRCVSDAP